MAISNNKTSLLVNSQVPEFVRNDHPQFVKFLESYYQFMEQELGTTNVSKNFNSNLNIDFANPDFEKKLYDNFLQSIPQSLIADKKLLLKHIKDFYRSRGSEKSLRFLLNILTPKIFVPASQNVNVLKLKSTLFNGVSNNALIVLQQYVGRQITGVDSGATGKVEHTDRTIENGIEFDTLTVVSIDGSFIPGENVYCRYSEGTGFNTLESKLFFSGVESIGINQFRRGYGYVEGTYVTIQSSTGENANAYISKVTPGNVTNITLVYSGAGFRTNDSITFTSNTGLGANAYVGSVNPDETYHQNTYVVLTTRISVEANTSIGNTLYSNVSAIVDPANDSIINVSQSFAYSNCGPIDSIIIANNGSGYKEIPVVDVAANTLARNIGVLGRLEIVDGGSNYAANDKITFINKPGSYGYDARANVTSVDANGSITEVKFEVYNNERAGGAGYEQTSLPTALVLSSTGNGANIVVRATIGDGEIITLTNTIIGAIEQFTVVEQGDGYLTPPLIDLSHIGSGDAEAIAFVRSGVLQWPNRFIEGEGEYTAERESEIYYPKRDILRASDGKWYIEKTLRVQNTSVNNTSNSLFSTLEKFKNTQIRGRLSNTTAIIERVNRFYEGGTQVDELVISSTKGDFLNGESVYGFFVENDITNYISTDIFNGAVNTVTITNPGSRYKIGDIVNVESTSGSNANVVVSKVSAGNIKSVVVTYSGAGFRVNDFVQFSSVYGFGANAFVAVVNDDGTYHPNSYNVITSTIDLEANTEVGNTKYSNLSISIVDPANSYIQNLMSSFVYSNTGPVETIFVNEVGEGYLPPITPDIFANTRIRGLGTLGRIDIVDGGQLYQVGEKIGFINIPGGYGYGALANITNVDINGAITEYRFESVDGKEQPGGAGFEINYLPTTKVTTTYGSGADLRVTAVLGDGEELIVANSSIGGIEQLTIINRGSGYVEAPTLNLSSIGDGTAQAVSTIIEGVYKYPGRYLNDDGMLSEANYLQNKEYYHNYSYVIKSKESLVNYVGQLKDTVHPAGMVILGELTYVDESEIGSSDVSVYDSEIITY